MTNSKQSIWLSLILCLIVAMPTMAQKQNLQPEDFKLWHSLGGSSLSDDGNWNAYTISRQEDSDTVFVKHTSTDKMYSLPFANGGSFSADNQWYAYRIGVSYAESQKLEEQKKSIEYKLGLLNLNSGNIETINSLSRFSFSDDGKFLAIYLAKPKDSKEKGSTLLLRDLAKGTTRNIGNVTEYGFNKKGDRLAFVTENEAFKSVEMINMANQSQVVIASDTVSFSNLTWHKEGGSLAFYKTMKHDDYDEESQQVMLYTGIYGTPNLKAFDHTSISNFPKDMRILASSNIAISKAEDAVFFGLQEWTPKDTTKTKKKDEKLPGVDVWHWEDTEIQPRQKVTYNQDKNRTHLSAWWPANNKFVRIGDDAQPITSLTEDHKYAVAYNPDDYKPAFKEDYADYYVVNTSTGEKKKMLDKQLSNFNSARTSAAGKFIAYFKDQNWWVYNIATNMHTNVTEDIEFPLYNINYDGPGTPPPYGLAGFSKDDKDILIYDQFDVYAISLDGKASRKLTDGRADEKVFRINRLDYEEPYIDITQPLYLSAYGDRTKYFGYYRMDSRGRVSELIYENMAIQRLSKAKKADKFTFVKQAGDVSPTMYVTDNSFSNPSVLVRTNPQQENYNWGKSELVTYTNADGKELQGALTYPANYEPGKQYPMVVYIYEILSNTVHGYSNPSERSAYNTTNFSQQDYFVFKPDIVYDIDDPGMSAVKCVVPAVEKMIGTGMIDKDKVALMGHSWGAYQTSFLITQTDLFAGAVAGAPLTDMISMSLSIYWNSGTPDQKIFETSQGRFSGPWYEQYEAHKRNSPIYGAQNIKTPLLVAFGDKDGAVDWQQGIEMYGTMRRMEKPHVMLVYEGENHGLAKRENQMDYYTKTKEWFDHFVLGKTAPKWITDGISYMEKMKARATPAPVGGQR